MLEAELTIRENDNCSRYHVTREYYIVAPDSDIIEFFFFYTNREREKINLYTHTHTHRFTAAVKVLSYRGIYRNTL